MTEVRNNYLVEIDLLDEVTGEHLSLEDLTSISINKDYINHSFPLFIIRFKSTKELYDRIRDNEFLINLKIQQYEFEDEVSPEKVTTPTITKETAEVLLKPFITFPKQNINIVKNENEEVETEKDSSYKLIELEIPCLPVNQIINNNEIINHVYKDCNFNDILAHILSRIESEKIYIDKPDNKVIQNQILIPPMNVISAVRYLQGLYGIYNTSMNIFLDYNSTYCYKLINGERKYKNILEIKVDPSEEVSNEGRYRDIFIDEKENKYKLFLRTDPVLEEKKLFLEDQLGKTTVMNSYDDSFNLMKRFYENNVDTEKVRYFWNNQGNIIKEEEMINSLKQGSITKIQYINVDLNEFNIDTEVVINSETEYINGRYNILGNNILLFSRDKKHFVLSGVLTLGKIE